MNTRPLQGVALLMLALLAVPAAAGGARSPEALAMAFVQAFRNGEVDSLVGLHYADRRTEPPRERNGWRFLVRNYRLAGYRVADLDGADRARLAQGRTSPAPLPIKKFVAQLVAEHSGERRVLEKYIGAKNGRFYFVLPDAR